MHRIQRLSAIADRSFINIQYNDMIASTTVFANETAEGGHMGRWLWFILVIIKICLHSTLDR